MNILCQKPADITWMSQLIWTTLGSGGTTVLTETSDDQNRRLGIIGGGHDER